MGFRISYSFDSMKYYIFKCLTLINVLFLQTNSSLQICVENNFIIHQAI